MVTSRKNERESCTAISLNMAQAVLLTVVAGILNTAVPQHGAQLILTEYLQGVLVNI